VINIKVVPNGLIYLIVNFQILWRLLSIFLNLSSFSALLEKGKAKSEIIFLFLTGRACQPIHDARLPTTRKATAPHHQPPLSLPTPRVSATVFPQSLAPLFNVSVLLHESRHPRHAKMLSDARPLPSHASPPAQLLERTPPISCCAATCRLPHPRLAAVATVPRFPPGQAAS
jgi:hypothetical protein